MPSRLQLAQGKVNAKRGRVLDDDDGLIQALRLSALGGAVAKIARKLNISESAVYKQVDGENHSCWESACHWLDGAIAAKPHARDEALAPLYHLIRRYLSDEDAPSIRRCVLDSTTDVLREVSELAKVAVEAASDEQITEDEYQTFTIEMTEALQALQRLQSQMQFRRHDAVSP